MEKIPGFSVASWINYCQQVTDIYATAFRHSRLEFDFSYLSESVDKIVGSGAREAADRFIQELIARNILLAQNGLNADWNTEQSPQHRRSFSYLLEARRQGKAVALEARSPMWNPAMQDVSALASTIQTIAPVRYDFFGTDAGALNYVEQGPNPANATTVKFMSHRTQTIAEIGQLTQRLVQLIGH
jgi:hypothetical protein